MYPLILYIPGLLPKPEPEIHSEALARCLLTGVRRVDPAVADAIETAGAFDIVSWTYDFYALALPPRRHDAVPDSSHCQ